VFAQCDLFSQSNGAVIMPLALARSGLPILR
jgi:hypothetical protein